MKKKNNLTHRILSVATAGCVLLGSGAAMAANTDISGHWAESVMQQFIDDGYLSGYGDGQYKPDQKVIRAEYATMINKVMEYTEPSQNISNYTDVSSSDWYYEHMAIALNAGYMVGTSNTTMSPKDDLTREQGFTMIAHILGLTDGTSKDLERFEDTEEVSGWAIPYVGALVRKGVVSGRSGTQLAAKDTMTRAEAVALLHQCLKQGEKDTYVYVSMNVPYADFYQAELEGNDDAVDVVSSATNNKSTKNGEGELLAGTYNDYDAEAWAAGTQTAVTIKGVTYPVRIKQSDLDKLTNTADTQADYYYTKLESTPSVYKTAAVAADGSISFGEVQGTTTERKDTAVSLSTSTAWGDYLLSVDTDAFDQQTVYGVTLTASKDGKTSEYGMRMEENIWRKTEIAWSSGVKTTEPHGNVLNYEHYTALMGSTVTGITYYTSAGIYTISCGEIYLPYKFTTDHFAVENALVTSKHAAVDTTDFPADYDKQYAVTNASGEDVSGFTCIGSNLVWLDTPEIGTYTLTVSDKSGKYASVSTTFELQTEAMPAAYDADKTAIVKASDASEEEFALYLSNISSVTVGETSYSASGRGAVKIINQDGSIDLNAESRNEAIFEAGQTYHVEVAAVGYTKTLCFELKIPEASTDPVVYTGTATTQPDEYHDFQAYDIAMDVTVTDGVIASIALNSQSAITEENATYFNRAMNGRGSLAGVQAQLTGIQAAELASTKIDVVSTATCSSNAIYQAVVNALTKK